jgi:hypothetical protein
VPQPTTLPLAHATLSKPRIIKLVRDYDQLFGISEEAVWGMKGLSDIRK